MKFISNGKVVAEIKAEGRIWPPGPDSPEHKLEGVTIDCRHGPMSWEAIEATFGIHNGIRLRSLRLSAGWTQEHLSKSIHVNTRTIQRWEAGSRHCPDLVLMLVERLVREAA